MLSDIGIVAVTIASTIVVCIVPVLYCVQRCSKRVIIMPQTQHVRMHIKTEHKEDLETNND